MAMFSKQVKKELVKALSNKRSAMFVLDGKLVSIEMEEGVSDHEGTKDLAQEIEEYPELKGVIESLYEQSRNEAIYGRGIKGDAQCAKRITVLYGRI